MSKAQKILDDIIEYYSTHNRGVLPEGACSYQLGCAVAFATGFDDEVLSLWDNFGRRTLKNFRHRRMDEAPQDTVFGTNIRYINDLVDVDKYFIKKYQGMSIEFWEEVQKLHDDPFYWERNNTDGWSLNKKGREVAAEIINNYE